MRTLAFQLMFAILLLLVSWKQQKQPDSTPKLIFQETTNSKDLRLSDIMTDVRFVPLETNNASLIGAYAKFIIGDKYIICISREKVLQFSTNGKYLRCLTAAGRGPEEFLNIMCYQVDKEENNFYFSQSRDNKIRKIKLSSGKFQNPILLPDGVQAEYFTLINTNRIAIFPYHREKTNYFVFYQDTLSHIIENIPFKRDAIMAPMTNSIQPAKWGQKLFFYHSALCGDTIYLVDNLKKTPYLIFNGGKKIEMQSSDADGFSYASFLISPGFCLFYNSHLQKAGETVNFLGTKFYMATGSNLELSEIKSLLNDYSGGIYSGNDLLKLMNLSINPDNKTVSFHMDALEFGKNAKANNFSSLTQIDQKNVQGILKNLTINDNPVLLIGKLK